MYNLLLSTYQNDMQGHPTVNFEKKDLKTTMNKAFWSHFKHFGRLLGKIYLFLTPSKTGGRVPSQQGKPTTCNVTYWEVSQQTYVQTLLASLDVVIILPSQGMSALHVSHRGYQYVWVSSSNRKIFFTGFIHKFKSNRHSFTCENFQTEFRHLRVFREQLV